MTESPLGLECFAPRAPARRTSAEPRLGEKLHQIEVAGRVGLAVTVADPRRVALLFHQSASAMRAVGFTSFPAWARVLAARSIRARRQAGQIAFASAARCAKENGRRTAYNSGISPKITPAASAPRTRPPLGVGRSSDFRVRFVQPSRRPAGSGPARLTRQWLGDWTNLHTLGYSGGGRPGLAPDSLCVDRSS